MSFTQFFFVKKRKGSFGCRKGKGKEKVFSFLFGVLLLDVFWHFNSTSAGEKEEIKSPIIKPLTKKEHNVKRERSETVNFVDQK